jgi:hypothetical protein
MIISFVASPPPQSKVEACRRRYQSGQAHVSVKKAAEGTLVVMASQRVRPEVAGPMTGSAKQSNAEAPLWIASSLRSSQ